MRLWGIGHSHIGSRQHLSMDHLPIGLEIELLETYSEDRPLGIWKLMQQIIPWSCDL